MSFSGPKSREEVIMNLALVYAKTSISAGSSPWMGKSICPRPCLQACVVPCCQSLRWLRDTNCSSSKGVRKVHLSLVGKQTTMNILHVRLVSKVHEPSSRESTLLLLGVPRSLLSFGCFVKWEGVGEGFWVLEACLWAL